MIINANDLCRTRLCRGHLCTNDAEPYQLVCATCERKRDAGKLRLHVTPELEPDTLKCSNCAAAKPDDAFDKSKTLFRRRYRHHECKACRNDRGTAARAADRAAYNAKQKARRKARLQAEVNTQGGI